MRSALLGVLCLSFSLVPAGSAGIIPVVYEGNIIEGLPGDQGLPFFLSGSPNNLRL
ncbi:MAG: hypothetical protein JNK48_31365, partial [Bryobacterales bacterium]|nr:hypothetical protein [Bryobacterales bacterium]